MSSRKPSDGRLTITNRSVTIDECGTELDKDDQRQERSGSNLEGQTAVTVQHEEKPVSSSVHQSTSSNISVTESNRSRSKTPLTNTSDVEPTATNSSQPSTSTGFNFFQSIKDLTHQELYRANPLGLLGKEVISATGTTHCPEPIPPKENNGIVVGTGGAPSPSSSTASNKLSAIDERNEPQYIHFPLNEEEKLHMQRRRSTLADISEAALPPCPAEFVSNSDHEDLHPHLFSQPSPTTMIADFIPDRMTINVFEVFIYAWGVFAFFFDMATDLVLAQAYYTEGAYWLFILTSMCVLVPNLTLSIFSLVWYIDGSQLKSARTDKHSTTQYNTSTYETNSSNEIHETDQRRNSKGSELMPLHEKRNSVSQLDDCNEEDQLDTHLSRLRQRPQTPEKDMVKRKHFHLSATTANVLTWIIRIIILVLQLDLCLKYIRGLYYTWKGFQKRHDPKWARFYLTKQILIDADIALLRVFDCFMDSGSQVTLQLYIMLRLGSTSMRFDDLFLKQCLSIVSSLGSLAYALSGYSRCWRHMQLTHSPQGWPKGKPAPQLVSWWSTIVQWVWYLFLITPRVLALAMFAATFRSWFWIIIVAHWSGMLFWVLRFRTIFCISDQTKYNPREAIFEKCYNLVCSYIFIFCYMNLRKGDTRTHYICFYTIYYIENIAFSIIYAIHSAETNLVLKYSLVAFVCGGFWFAVFFQFLYYRFLHPSQHVRVNTKRNLSSMVHIRTIPHFDHMKKSKSCQEMIGHSDIPNLNENNDLIETTSLHFDTSVDERWHNRFSKENRQKLILQQQVIDHNVRLTRAQKQSEEAMKRQNQSGLGFLSRISTRVTQPTSTSPMIASSHNTNNAPSQSAIIHAPTVDHRQQLFHVPHVSITKREQEKSYAKIHEEAEEEEDSDRQASHPQTQSKMYNINEDTHSSHGNRNNTSSSHSTNAAPEGGDEMILTASKLTSNVLSSAPSSSSAINKKITTTTTAALC